METATTHYIEIPLKIAAISYRIFSKRRNYCTFQSPEWRITTMFAFGNNAKKRSVMIVVKVIDPQKCLGAVGEWMEVTGIWRNYWLCLRGLYVSFRKMRTEKLLAFVFVRVLKFYESTRHFKWVAFWAKQVNNFMFVVKFSFQWQLEKNSHLSNGIHRSRGKK